MASSTEGVTEAGLFSGLFAQGEVAGEVSDAALLHAMLEVEAALLRALANLGLAPEEAAREVAAAADRASPDLDMAAIGRATGEQGTPVPGLLRALRSQLSDTASSYLHTGATSQDVMDTAMMLVTRRALGRIVADLGEAADACADLVGRHRQAIVPGRTLLQQALPVTFGLKSAVWLTGLDSVLDELADVGERVPALQFGGAVGTLASLGHRGLEVAAELAGQLALPLPDVPWHTIRARPARIASALGTALGVLGKIGRDVVLLAQTEVAEVAEGGGRSRGGSSTMPHKRNPVGAIGLVACAQRGPGLVATMLAAMGQEQERGAGTWQAEWETLPELLRLTGSAATIVKELLSGLEVDCEKMRADMEMTGSLVMSESVAAALAPAVGRAVAQELVEGAARRSVSGDRPFREVLLELPEVEDSLGPERLDAALDPAGYLGVTAELIDRALAAHRARGSR
jgi:3-carboxy-cis,cis-muconate cycloisomerase